MKPSAAIPGRTQWSWFGGWLVRTLEAQWNLLIQRKVRVSRFGLIEHSLFRAWEAMLSQDSRTHSQHSQVGRSQKWLNTLHVPITCWGDYLRWPMVVVQPGVENCNIQQTACSPDPGYRVKVDQTRPLLKSSNLQKAELFYSNQLFNMLSKLILQQNTPFHKIIRFRIANIPMKRPPIRFQ